MGVDPLKQKEIKTEKALADRLAKRASRRLVNKTDEKAFKPAMGLAFLGALGWNIPIPTVLGVMLGRWLDAHYKVASISWTQNCLLMGFFIGLFGAWQWLKREGIDKAQKEQVRRNALVDEAQNASEQKPSEEEILVADETSDEGEE